MGWTVSTTTGEMRGGDTKIVWDDSIRGLTAGVGGAEITDIGLTAEGSDGRQLTTNIGSNSIAISINDEGGPHLGHPTYCQDDNVRLVDRARWAITRLDHATNELNRERSYVGSEQNKLQFTMSNLSSNIQSIESSRSSIEDVDFAAEAADLAKNQILAQSGTAMLAQAAAISQNILGLLA